jgi:hypothetical protein
MPDDGKIIMCQIREKIEKNFFIIFSAQSIEGENIIASNIESKNMVEIFVEIY